MEKYSGNYMKNFDERNIESYEEAAIADDAVAGEIEFCSAEKPGASFKKFFTYERLLAAMTAFFGLWFIGSVIVGSLNKFHNWYSEAQANLVVIQNLRLVFILLLPYVLEKIFGLRVDLKILLFFYLFAFVAAVVGETFEVYYINGIYFDKILHGISGAFTLYVGFAFSQLLLKSSNAKHKFAIAMVFAVFFSAGVAALWEILEFGTDLLFGTNMQKIIPENTALFNGGDTWQDLWGSDEDLVEFFRHPEGYRYALMDTMWDMVIAFITTLAFIFVMAGIKAVKKDAFENCIIYNGEYRLNIIKNRAKARKETLEENNNQIE